MCSPVAGEGVMNPFIRAITSTDPRERDRPFHEIAAAMPPAASFCSGSVNSC